MVISNGDLSDGVVGMVAGMRCVGGGAGGGNEVCLV